MANTLAPQAIIGLLVPWGNTTTQIELEQLRPEGVCNAVARFGFGPDLIQSVVELGRNLLDCSPDAMIFGLSPELQKNGLKVLDAVEAGLKEATSLPIFNATRSVHAALRAIEARKVSIVTPAAAENSTWVRAVYEEAGFDVVRIIGLDRGLPNISKTELSAVKQAFVDANDPETEALVHVGTGLPVLALAQEVELDLGHPLIGCNAASYWQALRAMGIKHQVQGFGRLFAEF